MAQDTWLLNEFQVQVTGFFTTHHYFETPQGTWGELTFPAFASHGVFQAADGRELLMQKKHWLGTAHEFIEGELIRGQADRRGLLSRDIIIQFDGQEYVLESMGMLNRGYCLVDGTDTVLLEIQPRGVLQHGAYVTITSAVNADLVVFAYYLVHMRWQEDSAAAAAAS